MTFQSLLLAVLTLPGSYSAPSDLLAIRVGRAETISDGTLEHAVIVVEDGKIVAVGEDLPIERGVRVLDRPDWVAMPGFVDCHTRIGLDGRGGGSFAPDTLASAEIYPRQDVWEEVLERGVTTLGLYPAGSGTAGQAVAVRPHGETIEEMIVADRVYLMMRLATSAASKKALRDAFKKLDDYEEKVRKAREKWEKEVEKAKKKKKKDDDEEDEKKKEVGPFVPPTPDEKVEVFQRVRAKELPILFDIHKAADYLHLLDALGEEDIEWSLICPLRDDIDLYEVADKIGEAGRRITLTSRITLQPFTRRERNLPAELARAGASIGLLPTRDSVPGLENWRTEVGHLVAAGLDRQVALAGMTLQPAFVLGLQDRVGSLEAGKDANIVLWSGDPLEPSSRIQAVMLEGEFLAGEVNQ